MEEERFYTKERNDDAISHLDSYFREQGLDLFERWHACECYELSCLAHMSDHMRDLCMKLKQEDIDAVRASMSQTS